MRQSLGLRKLFRSPLALLMDEQGFGLSTATPVQQAIMLTMAKLPIPNELWMEEAVQRCFGGIAPCVGSLEEILVLSGVRGGKTLIAACGALWMSQKVDLSTTGGIKLQPGEIPRVSIVSARVDQAAAAFNYLKGALTKPGSPLNALLVEEPLSESLLVRHPSGAIIEICIVATASAGTSLVARWCAGVIFDEAPRMASEAEHAKRSLEEMVSGVRSRMLDGALIMYIGSPVGPVGLVYKVFESCFGKQNDSIFVVKARGPDMNPMWWTPERCARLKKKAPDDHRTDVDADFRDLETQMYAFASVIACMTRALKVIPPEDGKVYTATMDPATRGNAWTLLIGNTSDNIRHQINLAMQWIGSQAEPLSPRQTVKEAKEVLTPYRITTVTTDQYGADFLRDIMLEEGLGLNIVPFSGKNKFNMYNSVGMRMDACYLDLPNDETFRNDLLSVKKRVTTDEPKVVLPETLDGRHCDFAPPLALMCGRYLEETKESEKDERTVEEKLVHKEEQKLDWWELEKETYGGDDSEYPLDW